MRRTLPTYVVVGIGVILLILLVVILVAPPAPPAVVD